MQDLTVEQFVAQYEAPRVPVVLTGLTDAWPAQQEWTPEKLLEHFREHRFKVGVDTPVLHGVQAVAKAAGSVRRTSS